MRIDIMTLFPDTMNAVLHESIIGRAAKKGLVEINCVQIRDYTDNKQNQVDDYPYGGGWGCVMMAQPLKACLDHILTAPDGNPISSEERERTRVIYMSPQGAPYNQATARRLRDSYDRLVLVCGHYEGIDERFIEECVDEEISIGDYVLTGGEIAAMAVADSVCRLVPGVLADEECYTGESHWDGLLEYPQYTHPEVWENLTVPEILLTGDHAKISRWRKKQQLIRTEQKRPDMYEKLDLSSKESRELIREIQWERTRLQLTEPVTFRNAGPEDSAFITETVAEAKKLLKRRGLDQWQGDYPQLSDFEPNIEEGTCFIVLHGDEPAAVFCVSPKPEPCYEGLTDGKWTAPAENCCVVHRVAVSGKYRGTGISDRVFDFAEEICRAFGKTCIRVDTHRKNKSMKQLLERKDYRFRGNVLMDCEPDHDPARQAFDKVLK